LVSSFETEFISDFNFLSEEDDLG
jgi:hypothetical protein